MVVINAIHQIFLILAPFRHNDFSSWIPSNIVGLCDLFLAKNLRIEMMLVPSKLEHLIAMMKPSSALSL